MREVADRGSDYRDLIRWSAMPPFSFRQPPMAHITYAHASHGSSRHDAIAASAGRVSIKATRHRMMTLRAHSCLSPLWYHGYGDICRYLTKEARQKATPDARIFRKRLIF